MNTLRSLVDGHLLRFLLVGGINTLVGCAIMFGLYHFAGAGYWLSSAVNHLLTSILSYFLNKHFTFRDQQKGWKPVLRFFLCIACCWALAYGLAKPMTNRLLFSVSEHLRTQIAMLVGMVVFTVTNYLGQRLFAFRQTV